MSKIFSLKDVEEDYLPRVDEEDGNEITDDIQLRTNSAETAETRSQRPTYTKNVHSEIYI